MKVIIVGTQCTGKTTMVNALPQYLQKYVIKEVIREVCAKDKSLKYNDNAGAYEQNLFFDIYEQMLSSTPHYISDRGLFDIVVYTKYLCDIGKIDKSVYDIQYKRLVDFLNNNPDVRHIYIPICFNAIEDGFRSTNEEYRHAIDKNIIEISNKLIDDPNVSWFQLYEMCEIENEKRVNYLVERFCFTEYEDNIERIKHALDNNLCISITFNDTKSDVTFLITEVTHKEESTIKQRDTKITIRVDDALKLLAGRTIGS